MAFFNEFPYARTYDSDLGWIIRRIQEVAQIVDEYVSMNSIQFANPINWDITSQYPRLTIVLDSTGGAYISRQPVPAGVSLTNEEYWTEIYNTVAVINSIRDSIAYNNGDSDIARDDISKNQLFWHMGNLYIADSEILQGVQIIPGVNCHALTVDEKIELVAKSLQESIERIDMAESNIKYKTMRNVKDFGAVGDGVTNDTQAVIDTLNGKIDPIYFPDGTYLLDDDFSTNAPIIMSINARIIQSGGMQNSFV